MSDAYGTSLLAVLAANLKDRLGGRTARANARMGYLSPPPGDGRILWIKAPAHAESVWLAAELAHAVRECRHDVRLIFTFEEEFAPSTKRIAAVKRAGYGFGPADRSAAVRRVLERFAPLSGVIAVGASLRPRLASALSARGIPLVVVHGPRVDGQYGDVLPNTASEARDAGPHVLAAGPLMSMIVEAQVEPHFRGVAGAHARAVWWIADLPDAVLTDVIRQWRASPLAAHDLLFVGARGDLPRLSQWDRQPYSVGSVIAVDDDRYWSALAASATGIHAEQPGERLLWQILASGQVVSFAAPEGLDLLRPVPSAAVAREGLMAYWQGLIDDPVAARTRADALRRYFWNERRHAQDALAALLARVYEW